MKSVFSFFTLLMLLITNVDAKLAGAGFNCSKTTESVQLLICKSERLARQDRKLSELYERVLKRLPEDALEGVKEEQKQWLKARGHSCRHKRGMNEKQSLKCLLRCRNPVPERKSLVEIRY